MMKSPQDALRHSAAAKRNQQPILEVLRRVLPVSGRALEIAAGTGQHAAYFAAQLPAWTWQPTDADETALASIAAWRETQALPNLLAPRRLDVMTEWVGVPIVDAVFCANLLHIAPWATCTALMRGAAIHLAAHGVLIIYGPYVVEDHPTAPSNLAFDANLRARNSAWGLRRLSEIVAEAARAGLVLTERVSMPANNLTLILRRASKR